MPDLVERRLSLDPRRADTDGDGLPDGVDPVPNAAPSTETDSSAAATAFFEQYYGGSNAPGPGYPVVIVAEHALSHYGPLRPALVHTAAETERLAEQAEKGGFPFPDRIAFEPANHPQNTAGAMPLQALTKTGAAGDRALRGEREFTFTTYSGPLSAAGYQVVMRKIGARWYVRSFVQRWVS